MTVGTHRNLETPGFVYVTADIRNVTDRAVLIFDGKREVWVPRSQIEDPEEFHRGEVGVEILMTEWIAREKGLI